MEKRKQSDCQIVEVQHIAEGPQESLATGKSIRLFVRKSIGPRNIRKVKKYANNIINWFSKLQHRPEKPQPLSTASTSSNIPFEPGEQIRVRSREQIRDTLNHWGQLKGCSFAPEMERYCGTTQTILKPVTRFVDERDFRVLKTTGVYLLEGINCPGVASLGLCDRYCYFFWRHEWLEKVEV